MDQAYFIVLLILISIMVISIIIDLNTRNKKLRKRLAKEQKINHKVKRDMKHLLWINLRRRNSMYIEKLRRLYATMHAEILQERTANKLENFIDICTYGITGATDMGEYNLLFEIKNLSQGDVYRLKETMLSMDFTPTEQERVLAGIE